MDEAAVAGVQTSHYGGVRALVERKRVPAGLPLEKPTMEDVILFLVKGVDAK